MNWKNWEGNRAMSLAREFDKAHPFGEIYPPRPPADSLGRDPLDALLEMAFLSQNSAAKLRATRDTAAIASSNKNTLMFIDAIRGHL